ncbi:hypothetical protein RX327_33740 [Bradyrhizobium sp. BEA-2-5]|uniref:hypothetical protein n=1 Tax=Bradyrhizobium sp. BEA-2-5 TaxID=3080015 RepID=UPI00293E1302|nr:hypothetical protein [Bradyrhizobium sp. BEA-2-5]WOH80664.1 hypothetical protein RX327_33740 [Bradyrhizobium sp. BEA-2-5]
MAALLVGAAAYAVAGLLLQFLPLPHWGFFLVAFTTFTLKNVEEIRHKLIKLNGCVPPEITIYPWYTFVLHEMVRPYQGCVHQERVAGVHFAKGATRTYVQKADVRSPHCTARQNRRGDRRWESHSQVERYVCPHLG